MRLQLFAAEFLPVPREHLPPERQLRDGDAPAARPEIPSLESLQLPPVFQEIIKEKNGLVFVTGGTGSGKTTTLAAMLNEINQNQRGPHRHAGGSD